MKILIRKPVSLFVFGNIAKFAQINPAGEAYRQGAKEQISLPAEITASITFKEQQAKGLARENGFEPSAECRNFFADARAGQGAGRSGWNPPDRAARHE